MDMMINKIAFIIIATFITLTKQQKQSKMAQKAFTRPGGLI